MQQASFQADTPYATFGQTVAQAAPNERVMFIRKTYIHLAAAIYAFVALSWFILTALPMEKLMAQAMGIPYFGLIMLGGFILVSFLANKWANSDASPALQYAGLGLYVVAEAVIFAPLLYFAQSMTIDTGFGITTNVILAAGLLTLILFGALTAAVFVTGKDFSFLRTALWIATIGALGLMIVGAIAGFSLGFWFLAAMAGLAFGWILYDTSNVLHHYRTDQHVAASLALFASVALLFWYILRILMVFANND